MKKILPIALCAVFLSLGAFGVYRLSRVDMDALAALAQPKLSPHKTTVTIDPGHGGQDGGCVSVTGTPEKDINLYVALDTRDILNLMGYNVVMTREDDRSIHSDGVTGLSQQKLSDMENRLSIINSAPDGVALSIHQNQFTQSQWSGAQMFYHRPDRASSELADILQEQFRTLLQPDNARETKPVDDELYLLCNSRVPMVMAECGFLSNPQEAALLETTEYQRSTAFVLVSGVERYLEQEYVGDNIQE